MEFGRVPEEGLGNIDFNLPADSVFTLDTLRAAGTSSAFKIHVGLTKWGHKSWIGSLFPATIKESEFLSEYVKKFDTIEFNATFYTIYKKSQLTKWSAQAAINPDFKFCAKFPQTITHMRRLKRIEDLTAQFYEGLEGFDDRLGALFFQMGDNFSHKNSADLETFFEFVPKTYPLFLELRHPEWFLNLEIRDRVFNAMRDNGIGTVITDAAGRRDVLHMGLTIPKVMIRFVGTGNEKIDFSRLDYWVERIHQWKEQRLQEAWVFLHSNDDTTPPMLADYLIGQLNREIDLQLKQPILFQDF